MDYSTILPLVLYAIGVTGVAGFALGALRNRRH